MKINDCPSMLPFQIKICGLTNVDDTRWACQCGADAIGLNFYDKSKRFVDSDQASAIAYEIDRFNQQLDEQSTVQNVRVLKVGVFVGMPVAELLEISKRHGLDGIQLHGDECPDVVEAIRSGLSKNGQTCFLIRAIRSLPKEFGTASNSKQESARLSAEITSWNAAGIDFVLLDAAMPGEYGGTGKVIDIANISNLTSEIPLVLAGGLTPSNVADAILESGLSAVDVASGVESAPGLKDRRKVNEFVQLAMKSFQRIG